MKADQIIIANKLKRTDSITGLDVWYSTILNNIDYSITKVTVPLGTSISMGQEFTVLIPFTGKYRKYRDWKDLDRNKFFTLSQGDFIFLDNIDENIDANNIVQLKNRYSDICCEVRSVTEVENHFGATIQLKVSGI